MRKPDGFGVNSGTSTVGSEGSAAKPMVFVPTTISDKSRDVGISEIVNGAPFREMFALPRRTSVDLAIVRTANEEAEGHVANVMIMVPMSIAEQKKINSSNKNQPVHLGK